MIVFETEIRYVMQRQKSKTTGLLMLPTFDTARFSYGAHLSHKVLFTMLTSRGRRGRCSRCHCTHSGTRTRLSTTSRSWSWRTTCRRPQPWGPPAYPTAPQQEGGTVAHSRYEEQQPRAGRRSSIQPIAGRRNSSPQQEGGTVAHSRNEEQWPTAGRRNSGLQQE